MLLWGVVLVISLIENKLNLPGPMGGNIIVGLIGLVVGGIIGFITSCFVRLLELKTKHAVITAAIIATAFLLVVVPFFFTSYYIQSLLQEGKYQRVMVETLPLILIPLIFVLNVWTVAKINSPIQKSFLK